MKANDNQSNERTIYIKDLQQRVPVSMPSVSPSGFFAMGESPHLNLSRTSDRIITNKTNPNQHFIYIRSIKQKVPVTDEQFLAFYDEACRIRKREQYHHRCMCPKKFIWACDGDCLVCEYHTAGDILSLNASNTDDGTSLHDSQQTASVSMEDIISDRLLLEQLFHRLRELDPDADLIIKMLSDKMSDRAIAEKLGRKQRTFADQMKRIRTELRKVRGY